MLLTDSNDKKKSAPTARSIEAPLSRYNAKRDFKVTSEPAGVVRKRAPRKPAALSFVIQKHWASRLHYDFRLELHGEKLAGLWELVRISKPGEKKQDQWLLLKKRGDAWARPTSEYDVITALPDSVTQNRLGPVEEREPRLQARPTTTRSGTEPDL